VTLRARWVTLRARWVTLRAPPPTPHTRQPHDDDEPEPAPPQLRLPPVKLELELLQLSDEEGDGAHGEVPLTKKQVVDDLTALFKAVLSHYRHRDDTSDDDAPAPAPLSQHALEVTKAKQILMDTKQFLKRYDGQEPPPPHTPTYQARSQPQPLFGRQNSQGLSSPPYPQRHPPSPEKPPHPRYTCYLSTAKRPPPNEIAAIKSSC
jgi:hypothetical protein